MTDTPYQLAVNRIGEEKFQAVLTKDGAEVSAFEGKSVDEAKKKAQAYAAEHKAASLPPPIETYSHSFHL